MKERSAKRTDLLAISERASARAVDWTPTGRGPAVGSVSTGGGICASGSALVPSKHADAWLGGFGSGSGQVRRPHGTSGPRNRLSRQRPGLHSVTVTVPGFGRSGYGDQ